MARGVGRAMVVGPDYPAKRIDAKGASISCPRVRQCSVSATGPDKGAASAAAQRVAYHLPRIIDVEGPDRRRTRRIRQGAEGSRIAESVSALQLIEADGLPGCSSPWPRSKMPPDT